MQDSNPSSRDQPQTHQGEPASGGCFNPMEHMMAQLINIQQQMMTNNQEREEQQIERQRAHMEDQMGYERKKRDHEIELMTMQKEMEEMRFKQEGQQKLVYKITPWRDNDQPLSYLRRFEDTMTAAMIPPVEWHTRLVPLLSGRSLDAYSKYVPREATGNYPALKDGLLKALGISKERCQREFWFYRKKQGDTAQDAARDVETMAERMAEGCSSVEEVVKLFSFNKFLSLFPQEDAEFVQLKKPASILEAANVMEEHIWRRGPSRDGYRKQNCFQRNNLPPQGNSYKPHRPTEMTRNGLEQKDYLSQSTPTDKPFNGGYGNKITLTNTFTLHVLSVERQGTREHNALVK